MTSPLRPQCENDAMTWFPPFAVWFPRTRTESDRSSGAPTVLLSNSPPGGHIAVARNARYGATSSGRVGVRLFRRTGVRNLLLLDGCRRNYMPFGAASAKAAPVIRCCRSARWFGAITALGRDPLGLASARPPTWSWVPPTVESVTARGSARDRAMSLIDTPTSPCRHAWRAVRSCSSCALTAREDR